MNSVPHLKTDKEGNDQASARRKIVSLTNPPCDVAIIRKTEDGEQEPTATLDCRDWENTASIMCTASVYAVLRRAQNFLSALQSNSKLKTAEGVEWKGHPLHSIGARTQQRLHTGRRRSREEQFKQNPPEPLLVEPCLWSQQGWWRTVTQPATVDAAGSQSCCCGT